MACWLPVVRAQQSIGIGIKLQGKAEYDLACLECRASAKHTREASRHQRMLAQRLGRYTRKRPTQHSHTGHAGQSA